MGGCCCCGEEERTTAKKRKPSPQMMQKLKQQRQAEARSYIYDMFEKFDKNNKGSLARPELTQMVSQLSLSKKKLLSKEQTIKYVDFILKKADRDKDGRVTKKQLFQFYLHE